MKVAMIRPSTRTGEHRYSSYLIEGLQKNQINIEILKNPFLQRPNVRILAGSFLLEKLIKNKNINILHNLDNTGPYLFKAKKLKTISTIHDIFPIVMPSINNLIMNIDFRLFLPKLIENSDFIIVPSRSTKEDLISFLGINKKKIGIIPLGIETSLFSPKMSGRSVLAKYGIKGKYLLYVGGDSPRKNLINLIIAFTKIIDEIPHNLILVGPIRKNIVNIAMRKDTRLRIKEMQRRIMAIGYVDDRDLPNIFSGASAFLFPSLYEGFGFPPLEAMACGCPVIVSKNSSLSEMVGDAGAYISDPLNPDEIAKVIVDVINDETLLEKMKDKGLEQIRKFTWEKTVSRTIELYENI